MELDKQILQKTGWKERHLSFHGTLIFNVVDEKLNSIAEIVSRRDDKEISVDWFIPNKEGQKISLIFDTNLNEINKIKTDDEINTEKDVIAFLTTIENTIKDTKPQFFPSKKYMNEKILNEVILLGKPNVTILLKELKQFYIKNTENFLNAIEANDVINARKFNRLGLEWADSSIWKKIARIWRSSESTPETVKFIWTLAPDELYVKNNQVLTGHDEKYKTMSNLQDVWKEFLTANLNFILDAKNLPINNYLAEWILKHHKEKLDESPQYLDSLCCCVGKNKISNNIEFIEKIITEYPEKTFSFVDSSNDAEDFKAILNSKIFMREINKQDYKTITNKNNSMAKAVEKSNIEQVSFLVNLGVNFPESKLPYSVLFSKFNNEEVQNYVIDNIENIQIGDNVILKTILHYNHINLVSNVLNKYPSNSTNVLNKIIEKREANSSLTMVKTLILKLKLDEDLEHKPHHSFNKI